MTIIPIITLQSKPDAEIVAQYMRDRYPNTWKVTVREIDDIIVTHKVEMEFIVRMVAHGRGRRPSRLTNPEVSTFMNMLPREGQAFYAGMCKGREPRV